MNRLSVKLEDGLARPIFRIDSAFRQCWDTTMLLSIVLQLLIIPLLLADSFNDTLLSKHAVLFALSYMMDILYMMDVCLRALYFAYTKNGVVWSARQHIWRHYLSTDSYWLDIIIILPLDILAIGLGKKYLPLLRVLKALRVSKLSHYAATVERHFSAHIGWSLSFEARRMLMMFFALFQVSVNQYISCIYLR